MRMSDINGLQRLSARDNCVCQTVELLHRQEGVYQHRVSLSIDQRRRIGHPSLQQLHEVASTTEAHFKRQDVGDLLSSRTQRRHPRHELRGFLVTAAAADEMLDA